MICMPYILSEQFFLFYVTIVVIYSTQGSVDTHNKSPDTLMNAAFFLLTVFFKDRKKDTLKH